MGKPYSMDLRERVVAAVETGGLSRRRAAARFGVSYSAAIDWVARHRADRQPGAGADGRPQAEEDFRRLARVAAGALPGEGLHAARAGGRVGRARARGRLPFGVGVRPRREAHVTKKDADRQRAGSPRRRSPADPVEGVSGSDRPQAPGVHRRDLGQDQHDAAGGWALRAALAWSPRCRTAAGDHDLSGGAAPRPHRRALRHRRADQRRPAFAPMSSSSWSPP